MLPGRNPAAERWPPLSKRRNISSAERRTLFAPGKNFSRRPEKSLREFFISGCGVPLGSQAATRRIRHFIALISREQNNEDTSIYFTEQPGAASYRYASRVLLIMPQSLRTFTDDYGQVDFSEHVRIYPYVIRSYSLFGFFRVTNAVFSRETLCVP